MTDLNSKALILRTIQTMITLVIVCFACLLSAQEKDTLLILPAGYQNGYEDKLQYLVLDAAENYVQNNSRSILELYAFDEFQTQLSEKEIFAERVELARGYITLGIDLFQKMDIAGASKNLATGLRQFQEIGHAFISPNEVSTALLYLALTRLDESVDVGSVLNVFKEMILTDPKVFLKEGLYPANAVSYFQSAKNQINQSIRQGLFDSTMVSRASDLSKATYILNFSVLSENTNVRVILDVYDSEQSRFTERFEISVPSLDEALLRDAASRLTSQFITCLEEASFVPEVPLKSDGKSPWSLELGFTYVSFLRFPGPSDLEPFGNAGALIGLGYNFTEEFSLQFAAEILTSLRDKNGAISDQFQTVRIFGGSDIGIWFGDLKLSIGTFLEGAFIPDVSVCNPIDIRERTGTCSDTVPVDQFGSFLGANIRPKVSFRASDSFYLVASGNSSFYLLPFSGSPVNFPIAGEVGLKYRF